MLHDMRPPLVDVPGVDLDVVASFILYGLGIGFPILMCGLPMFCWWWRSQTWKMRDCWCYKRLMRSTGVDNFDDFDALISVHEAQHQNRSNGATSVRLTAGSFETETDSSTHSNFQQTFVMHVEQGTDRISVDLLDAYKRKMAYLKLDPVKDILNHPDGVSQKTYVMKSKMKGVGNARITMTIKLQKPEDEEVGLLPRLDGGRHAVEVEFQLKEHLRKVNWEEHVPPGDQMHTLAAACTGPVDYFSSWGVATPGQLAVLGPPHRRRWTLGFWNNPADFGRPGDVEVDLMRISSVQEDPGRSEVFVISYADQNRVESRVLFRRTDRSRDVWVQLLTMHISAVREQKTRTSEYASFKKGSMVRAPSGSRASHVEGRSSMRAEGSTRGDSGANRHRASTRMGVAHTENPGRRSNSERPTVGDKSEMVGSSSHRMSHSASRVSHSHSKSRKSHR